MTGNILNQPSLSAFDNVDYLGIAIKQTAPGRYHVGFLYRADDDCARLCHLGWDHDLSFDSIPNPSYLWVDVNMEESNKRYVAAWLKNQSVNANTIPYGLDSAGSCFDPATGHFIAPPLGKGLTCATYIVSVLKSLGFELVDPEQWPENRTGDVEWGEWIIGMMRMYNVSADHIDAVREDVGAKRVRPEEVAGASTLEDWPVSFESAEEVSRKIIQEISEFQNE